MNLTILPDEVLLDGQDLLSMKEAEKFLAAFGPPSRQRAIPMHPKGTRIAMVWDQLGLVAYEDLPERLMTHLYLAFCPAETPEKPSQPSDLVISINGGIVTAATLEHTLPRQGPTPISEDAGKHFSYDSEAFSLDLHFERTPNPNGRDLIVGTLHSFSLTWPEHATQAEQADPSKR